jgi:hypothetical protein
MKIWSCKIGECEESDLLRDGKYYGADGPMRKAIAEAYRQVTGKEPNFIFSGWGAQLEEIERAVVEDRLPNQEAPKPGNERSK